MTESVSMDKMGDTFTEFKSTTIASPLDSTLSTNDDDTAKDGIIIPGSNDLITPSQPIPPTETTPPINESTTLLNLSGDNCSSTPPAEAIQQLSPGATTTDNINNRKSAEEEMIYQHSISTDENMPQRFFKDNSDIYYNYPQNKRYGPYG